MNRLVWGIIQPMMREVQSKYQQAIRPFCEAPSHQSAAANSRRYLSPNSCPFSSFFFSRWELRAACSIHRLITPKTSISLLGSVQNTQLVSVHYLPAAPPESRRCDVRLTAAGLSGAKWMLTTDNVSRWRGAGSSISSSHMSGWWVIIINEEHLPVGAVPLWRGVTHLNDYTGRCRLPHWKCNTFNGL